MNSTRNVNDCLADQLFWVSAIGLCSFVMAGCTSERLPPAARPVVNEVRFTDISMMIDDKDIMGEKITLAAGETYSIAGQFRTASGKPTMIKASLLAEKGGRTVIMNEALIEFVAKDDLVTFEKPFRVTPKPGEYEFRLECGLDGELQEAEENIVVSKIVRVAATE